MSWVRQKLASWLADNLLAPVKEEDVLRVEIGSEGTKAWWQGRELSKAEISDLKAQAKSLRQDPFWKLLTDTLRYEASRKMFYESKSGEELIFGKAMLYSLKVVNNLLDLVKKL